MAVLNQVGYQQITVGTTVASLTPGGRQRRAYIRALNQPIRWRADGTSPSANIGSLVAAGDYVQWADPKNVPTDDYDDHWGMISRVQFIRDATATGDATLEVVYLS